MRYRLGKYGDIDPLKLIDSIELQSEYTPRPLSINVNGPSDPNTSAEIISYLQKAKPALIFHLNSGLGDHTIAPYGTPGPTHWDEYVTYAEIAGAVTLGLLLYAVIDIALPRSK